MNKNEYFLLDIVIEGRHFINVLTKPDIELYLNRITPKLSQKQLFIHLKNLFDSGYIVAYKKNGDKFIPTDKEIKKYLYSPKKKSIAPPYGLTEKGGALWEEYSFPNWDRYVYASYSVNDGEIISADKTLVERYLNLHPYRGKFIISGSETWDILSPWQATYWKLLPIGYRVQFLYKDQLMQTPVPETIHHQLQDIETWYGK